MGTIVIPVGLTLLSNPDNAVVDVVFVHGLQGHPRNTWTSFLKDTRLPPSGELKKDSPPKSSPFRFSFRRNRKPLTKKAGGESSSDAEDRYTEVKGQAESNNDGRNKQAAAKSLFWPEDLLKPDFPKARIMTFGYNTKLQQGYQPVNQGNIFSHAKNLLYELERKRRQATSRHLIFIAHSLGGILVKEVFRRSEADHDENMKKIHQSTTGIFFFSTPHRGSKDWASLGESVVAIAGRLLGMDVNREVIRALVAGPELELCQESFTALWVQRGNTLTVRTFQEAKGITGIGLGGFNELIVPPDSSRLDHPNERARSMDANHMNMVKFGGKHDKGYEMVKDDIEELILRAEEITTRSGVPGLPKEKQMDDLSHEERECLQALRTSDYEEFKNRNPNRLEETCQWVLQHENFKSWKESNSSGLLWVSADPGCGKSVLSRSLVDEDIKSTGTCTTCYFFFKDDNDIQKNAATALSAVLHQLFSQKPILIEYAMSDYAADGDKLPQLFHKLWDILIKAAADPNAGSVVCVLDALDECREVGRYQIIDAVTTFYKHAKPQKSSSQLKFLITSRPYIDMERRFTTLISAFPTSRLQGEEETEAISREIDIVIKWKASELARELKLDNSEQSTLKDELLSMTHRTYLWLKLIVEVIRDEIGITKKKLMRIIGTLPATVDQAYEAILIKIKDPIRARKLLHIIVAATRPLTLKELNIALAIEDHHQCYDDLDLENDAQLKSSVRNLCGLFVTVVDQKVYLIHQTAKEFLIAKTAALTGQWKHSLSSVESDYCIATACIIYLNFTSSDDDPIPSDKAKSDAAKRHGFFAYAACFWAKHFRQAQSKATAELSEAVLQICDTQRQQFQNWFSKYWLVTNGRFIRGPNFTSSLIVESYFGHEKIVKLLLTTRDVDTDSKDRYGQTSLSWAARKGHKDVVKLLLATGDVDVNSKDNKYGQTPLSLAAENGHEDVVKLLLATGDVNADLKDFDSQTPLSWAARNGHKNVVRLLLATGYVDIDSKDCEYGRTPLSWAAGNGHEDVVKLLLATRNVDIDLKDTDYGQTPLSWAAENGHEDVVKLLLATRDVDVNSKSEYGQTPLSRAAGNGHENVVKLLLVTRGVNADLKDEYNQTPLSLAARNGHDDVVKLLLATGGVDVNSKDKEHGQTSLSWAAENGHEDVIKLLLVSSNINADSKDKHGRTPLSWAATKGHEDVVKLLLSTPDIDINSRDNKYGQTPLSKAAEKGHDGVVKLLLATAKINVNSKENKNGQTPLSWAAGNGHEDVVKLLLATGNIDADSKDMFNRTPLSWAARNGQKDVVRLLLTTGDVDADSKENKYSRTPLSWAAGNGYQDVVKLLLVTGEVDVDLKDINGRTPLLWAARNGHESVVKLLLATGNIDVNSKENKYGQTPLAWAAGNGHEGVVKLLLATGDVNVNSKDINGQTPLLLAAGKGREDVIKLLLATGDVKADSKDIDGQAPLS